MEMGAPIALSFPHFYQADPAYVEAVDGLAPDPVKHSMFFDVDPRLGLPMQVRARFQVNFPTFNMSTIKLLRSMPSIVFPVMWAETVVDGLPSRVVNLVTMAREVPTQVEIGAIILWVALCLVALGILAVIFFRERSELNMDSKDVRHEFESSGTYTSGGHVNPIVSSENPD